MIYRINISNWKEDGILDLEATLQKTFPGMLKTYDFEKNSISYTVRLESTNIKIGKEYYSAPLFFETLADKAKECYNIELEVRHKDGVEYQIGAKK